MRFGPSGNCISFYADKNKRSVEAPKWLREKMNLSAYEYSFGRGINLGDEMAVAIGEEAKKYDIHVSVHAPYFINFASPTEQNVINSYNYVLNSLRKLRLLGGNRLVVHTGSQGKLDRETAIKLAQEKLTILKDKLIEEGFSDMLICLEAMGKPAQIGSYKEVIDLCTIYENYIPTLDFGHINAVTQGGLKTVEDYEKVIKYMFEKLGEERAKKVHIHFSKIEYGEKGEIRHLTLDDTIYGPEFEPLAYVLKKYDMNNAVVISESKEQMAIDAKRLQDIYNATNL